jgi:ABC-2 type transport system ATP-binding protein
MTSPSQRPAVEADGLGVRYQRGWALRDCTFTLPAGGVVALIGPNGAGKTTLMMVAMAMLQPTTCELRIFGAAPGTPAARARVAFLAQERPLYGGFTVADTLRMGRRLNPTWDQPYAERLVHEAGLPMGAKVGALSGGQQSRVALALVLGRRPDLVLLDEPLADLDPLARQQVMRTLLDEAAATGMTVVLSSHVIAELDGICDHLLVLREGGVRLDGAVADLTAGHRLLTGPDPAAPAGFSPHQVVDSWARGGESTTLVRTAGPLEPGDRTVSTPGLEELVLAYLRSADAAPVRSPEVAA